MKNNACSFRPVQPRRASSFAHCLCVIASVAVSCAQNADLVHVDIEASNVRSYRFDNPDPTRFATEPGPIPAVVAPNFQQWVGIQDLKLANGKPVMGVIVFRVTRLALSPTPAANGAIADVARPSIVDIALEMLDETGAPLGGITAHGLFGGTAPADALRPMGGPPPGFPNADFVGNVAVTGGTGIFLGARGYLVSGLSSLLQPSGQPLPDASVTENPRNRRSVGPLATSRFILVLLPAYRPSVSVEADRPLIYHADFSPVNTGNAARPGEVLIVRGRSFGPTSPGLAPGARFASDPLQTLVAPVEALIGGRHAEVVNRIGWPGTSDEYRIDVRVPSGVEPGTASLNLVSGFIPAAPVQVPICR